MEHIITANAQHYRIDNDFAVKGDLGGKIGKGFQVDQLSRKRFCSIMIPCIAWNHRSSEEIQVKIFITTTI